MDRLYAILLLVVLMGCSRDVDSLETTSSSAQIMRFSISTTRATVVTSQADMGSIGLYCAYTADEYWSANSRFEKMDNHFLSYSEQQDEWLYNLGEEVMWGYLSLYDRYTIYGYSPHTTTRDDTCSSIVEGELVLAHTSAPLSKNQIDLMIAQPLKDIYPQVAGSVNLTFDHVLSMIEFIAEGADDVVVSITGVVVEGEVIHRGDAIEWQYSGDSVGALSTNLAEPNALLMVIPQVIPFTATIEVEAVVDGRVINESFALSSSSIAEWEPSMCYRYTFSVSDTLILDSDVEVENWDEVVSAESFDDDAMPLPALNCINLDIFNTIESLLSTISDRMDLGVGEFILYGEYIVALFGDGSSSGGSSPLLTSIIATDLDMSRVEGVTEGRVPDYAFYQMSGVDKITLPNVVSGIGNYSFAGSDIIEISLASVEDIGESAFYQCLTLESLGELPNLECVGVSAFKYCRALTDISMPSVVTIEEQAFNTCRYLERVALPNVEYIGYAAFEDCANLECVESTTKLRTIGEDAFLGCESLTTIDLSAAESIGSSAFEECSSLVDIGTLSMLQSVNPYTFSGCSALLSIDLPAATYVGTRAFEDLSSGVEIRLTSSEPITITYVSRYDDWDKYNLVLHISKQSEVAEDGVTWGGGEWGSISYVYDEL